MTVRIGSLFSGAGMLDEGVRAVVGGEAVWQCEVDPHAARVLEARYPGVPNLGDITAVDWSTVEPVDVLCGGFPCQDVSVAGLRAGLAGKRSGLWSEFVRATDALRPPTVVVENVRGLLTHRDKESGVKAIDVVLGGLRELGYGVRWMVLPAAAVGAPHRRDRVFIVGSQSWSGVERVEAPEGAEAAALLLPTPVAQQSGNPPEVHLAKKPGRSRVTDLAIIVENGLLESGGELLPLSAIPLLLPTPIAGDAKSTRNETAVRHRMPPTGVHAGTTLTDVLWSNEASLLPTPRASDSTGAGVRGEGGINLREAAARIGESDGDALLPTPRASRGAASTETAYRLGGVRDDVGDRQGNVVFPANVAWGRYEPAIRRWEALTRPVPPPAEPNRNGKPRLVAAFSEWMMGWPAGWVTGVVEARTHSLRIIGNGCVPQQVSAALQLLGLRHGNLVDLMEVDDREDEDEGMLW